MNFRKKAFIIALAVEALKNKYSSYRDDPEIKNFVDLGTYYYRRNKESYDFTLSALKAVESMVQDILSSPESTFCDYIERSNLDNYGALCSITEPHEHSVCAKVK